MFQQRCNNEGGETIEDAICPAEDRKFYYVGWMYMNNQWDVMNYNVLYNRLFQLNPVVSEYEVSTAESGYAMHEENTQNCPPLRFYKCAPNGEVIQTWVAGCPVGG